MKAFAALTALALTLAGAAFAAQREAVAQRPRRIVSLNLCADQLLVALADRDQIAALNRFVRDPDMSAVAARAGGYPVSRGSLEDVLALDPDLVVAAPYWRGMATTGLRGREIRTLELPSAESYAAIVAQVRQVAAAVGHPERGEAMVRRMDAILAALPRPGHAGVAAYYQRRGFLTGKGTLVDELMARAGLTNLATKLGKPALGRLSVEEMVAAHPDYLIVDSGSARIDDLGTEMLNHPALADIPRISLPDSWTVCGGPTYALAAQSLTRQLARLRAGRATLLHSRTRTPA